jgi:orotate phosphoribosyltransferase
LNELESLVSLLRERSLRTGSFRLASGRQSSYYIDARPTTMSAAGLQLIGSLGLEAIRDTPWHPHLVGGLTLGADPVAYAIALTSQADPPALDAFTIRKEAKAHGTGRQIEGCYTPGARIVVVEDVITTGGSALKAIEVLEDAAASVQGVLAVVDRLEGGRQAIEKAGYPVRVLVTTDDLGAKPSMEGG